MPMSSGDNCITYHLDRDNRLSFLSDQWSVFAADNQAAHLTSTFVINKPVFAFISDESSRHLYRILITRTRQENASFRFPFRCDAPDRRRFMEMEIFPLANESIGFRSCILKEEAREPVALLDAGAARSDEFVKVCSWCKKVELNPSDWAEVEDAITRLGLFNAVELPSLTHGMCPACHEDYVNKLLGKKNDR